MTARAPSVKGWCPGAYHPMMSGDGLVVRVRPTLARFEAAVLAEICTLAARHGNGILEFTNRANLQLRGVTEDGLPALLDGLDALGVLDEDPSLEGRRNIVTSPFYAPGDLTARLSSGLRARLTELPALPAKFGFAVDTGGRRLLASASADIRLERSLDGALIIRADGAETGVMVDEDAAIDAAIALAHWFVQTAPSGTKRMARLLDHTALPAEWTGAAPVPASATPTLGTTDIGQLVAVPFGQIDASALGEILPATNALRITPWRIALLEGTHDITHPALITDPNDPLLHVDACPGAPRCAQASVNTHQIARALAPHMTARLHVSGCEKGCARASPTATTLVGRNGRFDIVRGGTAQATPTLRGLTAADLLKELS